MNLNHHSTIASRRGTSLWSLPIAACIGGVVSSYLVFLLARSREDGRASIVMLLLTGLAVNALFMSAIGFLSYIARDVFGVRPTFVESGDSGVHLVFGVD